MIIDQHTSLYGLIGFPLGHSISPAMHNAAFPAAGINAVYLAFETRRVRECIPAMKALGIKGMSVTLPHKSAIIPLLDEVDEIARRIGAVNTVVNQEDRLIGYNTDATGVLRALEGKIDLVDKSCLILGAGGAARAVGFMLKQCSVQLTVANRSSSKGEELADILKCSFVPLSRVMEVGADLVVQATPVGMYPNVNESIVPPEFFKEGMTVMDVVYHPVETKLLRTARERNCLTVDGLEMFIHQGAEQFRLWTGLRPPLLEMTRAAENALGRPR